MHSSASMHSFAQGMRLARALRLLSAAALCGAVLATAGIERAAAQQQPDPTGIWVNQERSTKVRVSRCGGALCGSVSWLREPLDREGKPKVDRENPDASQRGRRLIGLPVLLNMKPSGDNRWSGRIYNADDGNTYMSHVEMASADSMRVQGCVLGGLICRNMTWSRDGGGKSAGQ